MHSESNKKVIRPTPKNFIVFLQLILLMAEMQKQYDLSALPI